MPEQIKNNAQSIADASKMPAISGADVAKKAEAARQSIANAISAADAKNASGDGAEKQNAAPSKQQAFEEGQSDAGNIPGHDGEMPIIKMENIVKSFYVGTESELEILHGINFEVFEGEFVAIVGASGSGKSTLMNIIGALDKATSGTYMLDGVDVSTLTDRELSHIRCQKIGFVFQTFNLIARTNALKNVELPMMYDNIPRAERSKRAKELLEMVEMTDRATHQPNELSGGQKQRVAIARSMANNPAIILADEPTGALDSKTGRLVMDIFHRLHEEQGKTIVLITHSKELAEECQRIITIRDGNIIGTRPGNGVRA